MHESQPDPEEPEEHDSGFDVPEDDEPDIPSNYPPTVAAFFDAAGITQPE